MSAYDILFRHEAAVDLAELETGERERLLSTIETLLADDPRDFGKPLSAPLKGLRRIRMGEYRIAYEVEDARVIIWAIKPRKVVYRELEKRFLRHRD